MVDGRGKGGDVIKIELESIGGGTLKTIRSWSGKNGTKCIQRVELDRKKIWYQENIMNLFSKPINKIIIWRLEMIK